MWELVRERDGLTDQMLLDRMREIDLRDGHADGKITSVPVTCPSCARLTGARTGRCVFCGATLPDQQTAVQINADMAYWAAHRDEIGKRWYAWQAQ